VPAWTPAQIEAIAKILAWANKTYAIPLSLIPDTEDATRGIGYHRQGIDPYRKHGEQYSTSYGKVCPGDRRVAQIPQVIARAVAIVNGDDDVPLTYDEIEAVAKRTAAWVWGIEKGGYQLQQNVGQIKTAVAAQADDETKILEAVKAVVAAPVDLDALADKIAAKIVIPPSDLTQDGVKAAVKAALAEGVSPAVPA